MRSLFAPLAFTLAAVSILSCKDLTASDEFADRTPPKIKLTSAESAIDTLLQFSAHVTDNLGIKRVQFSAIGGVTSQYDTVFTSAVTATDLALSLSIPRTIPAGTPVTIIAIAIDGAGNQSSPDTLRLATGNVAPADPKITSPASGSTAVIGKSIVISLSGTSKLHVRWLGFTTNSELIPGDSTGFSTPLKDSTAILDTIAIPASMPENSLVITPFLRDSVGNRTEGPPITLRVQAATNSTAPPTVTFGSDKRVELSDTVFVTAMDTTGAGIQTLGIEVRQTLDGPVITENTFPSDARFTTQQHTFTLALPPHLFTTFPQTIYVKAYAVTGNNIKGYAKLANGVDRVDTLTVVAGTTRRLPNGGSVADALYHSTKDRLYLTNIDRNQLEVFDLDNTRFIASIPVGSRPWGIAHWPRSRIGLPGDTILVANSGGTSISYIDLANTSPLFPEGREVYRYPLPNIIVYTVTTKLSAEGVGPIKVRTAYDFSDRPQYIATTCKTQSLLTELCTEVILVYSTTPTPGQSVPFMNRGTLRYENLTTKQSHFFFEPAIGQADSRSDTLEIVRYGAGCVDLPNGTRQCVGAEDSVLVPSSQRVITADGDTVLHSIVVKIDQLAFRDTTFVRNSGNFRRAIFGEGGSVLGSRVIAYDAMRGLDPLIPGTSVPMPLPVIDKGISPPADVSDFIANTNAKVRGVGINFDGELSAVRADSIYLIDQGLRLQGLIQTPTSTNPGFDFHPSHTGNGISSPLQSCYIFSASAEPVIEVYETKHYQLVLRIPVKSPIIGPIKAAIRPLTNQLMLIGATSRGVITVPLSSSYTSLMTSCPQ
jgi:hypothetical protein